LLTIGHRGRDMRNKTVRRLKRVVDKRKQVERLASMSSNQIAELIKTKPQVERLDHEQREHIQHILSS
jgi:uncharacterized protein Smg (DUF494 family)